MKHLKRFNERCSYTKMKDIQKECNEYLSFLLDSRSDIIADMDIFDDRYSLSILINQWTIITDYFYWEDIKYDFLPLLQIMSEKYNIVSLSSDIPSISFITVDDNGKQGRHFAYKLETILNENENLENIKLKQVYFYFK